MILPGFPRVMGAGGATVADLFSAQAYTGTGASRTIANGLDLAGEGGLVWTKRRDTGLGSILFDSSSGFLDWVASQSGGAKETWNAMGSLSNGYSLVTPSGTPGNDPWINANGGSYVSWSFRRAPNFFDVISYAGNNTSGRQVPHNLGVAPGLVLVKRTSGTDDWCVWHRWLNGQGVFYLNYINPGNTSDTSSFPSAPTSSNVNLGAWRGVNSTGSNYIGYVFAHDPAGFIQCPYFTANSSGTGSINHGWSEGVQFVLIKCATDSGDWEMYDTARSPGWTTDLRLRANLVNAEDTVTRISGSGSTISFSGLSPNQTYITMLVRG